jgi:hypothetical protein
MITDHIEHGLLTAFVRTCRDESFRLVEDNIAKRAMLRRLTLDLNPVSLEIDPTVRIQLHAFIDRYVSVLDKTDCLRP